MKSKAENHHLNLNKRPRGDTFRKKILRDMREFYRILFRKRFIVSEYKTIEGIKEWMITLFDELGLPLDEEDQDNFELFKYIHQTHQHIRLKLKISEKSQESSWIFQVIENYNEINFLKFLKHPLCSRMFYFVFKNYLHHYYPLIKDAEFSRENKRSKKSGKKIDYRKQVMTIIKLLLNWYKRMTKPEHINRIDYLLN